MKTTHTLLKVLIVTIGIIASFACKKEVTGTGDEEKKVDPPSEMKVEYTLAENTHIFSEKSNGKILSVNTEVREFYMPEDTPKDKLPKVGDIYIINNTDIFPEGAIVAVENVGLSYQATTTYGVRYKEVTDFAKCFKELKIEEGVIDIDKYASKVVDAEGKELKFTKTKAASSQNFSIVVPKVDFPLGTDRVTVTPNVTVDLTLKFQMLVSDYTLSTFNAVLETDYNLGADVSFQYAGDKYWYMPLLTIYCAAIPVGPILILPKIQVDGIVSTGGSIKLKATVSYKSSQRCGVHYNEQDGLSVSSKLVDKPGNGMQPFTFGPELGGSFRFGLGLGPHVTIYGKLFSIGVSASAMLKISLSQFMNLLGDFYDNGYSLITGVNLDFDFVTNLYATFETVGFEKRVETPEASLPIDTYKLLPVVSKHKLEYLSGDEATLKLWLTGKPLFWGPMKGVLHGIGLDNIYADFDIDEEKVELLRKGKADTVVVEATVKGILPNKEYSAVAKIDVFGKDLGMKYLGKIKSVSSDVDEAIRGILAEIHKCAIGDWKDCNWLDPNVRVRDMVNVTSGSHFSIYVPDNWQAGGSFHVTDHSSKLGDMKWQLIMNGVESKHFTSVTIDDKNCIKAFVGDNVETYSYHSAEPFYDYTIPANVKKLDLSDSKIEYLTIDDKFLLTALVLDDCEELRSLRFEFKSQGGLNKNLPKVSAKNCSKLERIECKNVTIPSGFFEKVDLNGLMLVSHSQMGDFTAPKGITSFLSSGSKLLSLNFVNTPKLNEISLSQSTAEGTINISNCNSLEELYFDSESKYDIPTVLYVNSCPSLKKMRVTRTGMTEFYTDDLPALTSLSLNSNKKFKGLMQPVMDRMLNEDKSIGYDQRYEYLGKTADGEISYIDRGYGFYYEGEPERGYHRK